MPSIEGKAVIVVIAVTTKPGLPYSVACNPKLLALFSFQKKIIRIIFLQEEEKKNIFGRYSEDILFLC